MHSKESALYRPAYGAETLDGCCTVVPASVVEAVVVSVFSVVVVTVVSLVEVTAGVVRTTPDSSEFVVWYDTASVCNGICVVMTDVIADDADAAISSEDEAEVCATVDFVTTVVITVEVDDDSAVVCDSVSASASNTALTVSAVLFSVALPQPTARHSRLQQRKSVVILRFIKILSIARTYLSSLRYPFLIRNNVPKYILFQDWADRSKP